VAAHVSTVGSHARKPYELRFQNPGARDPVANPQRSFPVLLGLYDGSRTPILIGLDGRSRLGRAARFSILFNKSVVDEARVRGWAVYTSSTGENIYGFHPSLFPLLIEIVVSGLDAPAAKSTSDDLGSLAVAAGLLDDDTPGSRLRARRAADVLIRDRAFGRGVVNTYGGLCAMCGIDYQLVVGAHIYPASAPGSPDKAWNGLALCHNHHAAFDSHRIWVEPDTKAIAIHPSLVEQAPANTALAAFLQSTYPSLSPPSIKAARPREEMFVRRYDYYAGHYAWAA
jgi:hypothetical protein